MQRSCARHIYANWHKTHQGDEFKMLFWNAAKAYNDTDFKISLDELKNASPKATDDFLTHNPSVFCRAFMNTNNKCDVILNNMVETFNAYIALARAKYLIYMLEDIRLTLIERIVLKRTTIEKTTDGVCPRIRVKLEKEREESRNCHLLPSRNRIFEVTHKLDSVHVDMNLSCCTCRSSNLRGASCCHAIACSIWLKEDVEGFLHPYI